MRKVLLALDYLVECSGGCFIFIVIFVGDESLLQQHILLTIGSFIYGVPIPLAYLLNETRVRNIIIKKGWIEGFISIFHSPEKIKQLERERIMLYLHPETSRNQEVYVSQKVDNCCKVNYLKKNINETNIENEISENNETMKNINSHQNVDFQALGPSTSEPPSTTMSDGTGLVKYHPLCLLFIAKM